MANMVLNEEDIDTLELEILSHASLPALAQIYPLYDNTRKQFHLMMKKKETDISIRELIQADYFTTDKIKALLENLLDLQHKVEDYLLDKNKIQYDIDWVFLNTTSQEYRYLYKPTKSTEVNKSLRYFIIDLLLAIDAMHLLPDPFDHVVNLEVLIQNLNTLSPLKSGRSVIQEKSLNLSFFERLFKKDKKETPLKTKRIGETIVMPLKASLIDKHDHTLIYPLNFETNSIGRGTHCNIHIENDSVSQEHATIAIQNGQYILKDLGSKNGTYLNGTRIDNSKNLTSGNFIKFGEKEFVFIL